MSLIVFVIAVVVVVIISWPLWLIKYLMGNCQKQASVEIVAETVSKLAA